MKAEKSAPPMPLLRARDDVRRALPLSVLFAGLIANCGTEDLYGGSCSTTAPINDVVFASEEDYRYFAHGDGTLDFQECLDLCRCLDRNFSTGGPFPPEAGAAQDASTGEAAMDGAATDGGEPDDAGQGGDPVDAGPAMPRCEQGGVRGFTRLTECVDRGPNASGGHELLCKGSHNDGVICGRGGACHVHLGRGLGESAVARWLAFAAATEAASIRSFTTLRRELCALGAPATLVSRAHSAARDEARHARWMLRLARRWRGTVVKPERAHLPPRDLETVARENAVEGCVNETWAALLNHHQALHASDADVRSIMARIAADETSHAELAHDIDRWAMGALPPAARARVARAKRAAVRALASALRDPEPSLKTVLGLPPRARLQFFAEELEKRLWS